MSEEEILSQDEMNALTGKDEGGSAKEELFEGGQVLAYDFKQPEHAKQSHFPTLQIINEKTATNLKEKLEFMLQQKVEVNAGEIIINKYGEFVNSLNIPIDIKRIKISQLKGSFLVCFDDQLINAVIEEYFGAPQDLPSSATGSSSSETDEVEADDATDEDEEVSSENEVEESADNEADDDVFDDDTEEEPEEFVEKEEFTNAESRISQKLLSYLLESMQDGWSLLDNYSFDLEQTEKNPRLINYIDHDELIVNINFRIEIREKMTAIKIGVPYKILDKIKHQLRRVVQTNTEAGDAKWQKKLYKKLQSVPVEVVGELGRVTLPVNKLVRLKVGDVIGMPKPEHITVYANKTPVMQGNIGESNGQTAIQINSWIKANKREQ